jgi:lysosomal Pro-X carboxypeptidase
MMPAVFVLWICLIGLAFSTAHIRPKLSGTRSRQGTLTSVPNYSVKYFEQQLDHFNAADQRTFQQRYLVNQEKWEGGGPILLYTGNEGDITWFCNNTVGQLIKKRRCG